MDAALLLKVAGVGHVAIGSALMAFALWLWQKGLPVVGVGFDLVAVFNIGFGCWAMRRERPKNPHD